MIKKLIFSALFGASSSSFAISAAQIEYDVAVLSKQTPSRVDQATTLREIQFANTLFFKGVIYTMQVDSDAATLKGIEATIKSYLKSSMCGSKWPREVMSSGFTIDHFYQDRTGAPVIVNRLTIKDCR